MAKKEVFQILATKAKNGLIVCETSFDQERLKTLEIGTPLKITVIRNPRNYGHHKKFFKLLSEAFVYWQPKFEVMTQAENWLIDTYHNEVTKFIQGFAENEQAKNHIAEMLTELKTATVQKLANKRKEKLDYEGMKTLEGYLDYVMKKAGCFDVKPATEGGTLKQRWSIAFDNMPQAVFNDVYKRCFGVIWNETLCNVFASEEDLENRLAMLLNFE